MTKTESPGAGYLLAGQASELERLQLQSRVWEPALRPRLEALIAPTEIDQLLTRVEAALAREDTWGTTFTLVQSWANVP